MLVLSAARWIFSIGLMASVKKTSARLIIPFLTVVDSSAASARSWNPAQFLGPEPKAGRLTPQSQCPAASSRMDPASNAFSTPSRIVATMRSTYAS